MVKRRAIEMNIEAPEIDQLFSNRVKKKKTWDDPIKKVIPDSKEKQDVVGMIREIVEHLDPFKKLCIQQGTIAESQLGKILPAKVSQITIHAGVTGESQIESYTFWISVNLKEIKKIKCGNIVSVKLKEISVLGCDKFWLVDSLNMVFC